MCLTNELDSLRPFLSEEGTSSNYASIIAKNECFRNSRVGSHFDKVNFLLFQGRKMQTDTGKIGEMSPNLTLKGLFSHVNTFGSAFRNYTVCAPGIKVF